MRRAARLLVALAFGCSSGCGGTDRASAPKPPVTPTIAFTFQDIDWVHGQYFLLYDPNFGTVYDIDEASLRVYRDDGIANNDLGETREGLAVIDPDGAMQLPLSSEQATASVRGWFNMLRIGPDADYEVLNDVYAFGDTIFKVLRLRTPILRSLNQTLAVSYRASRIIGPGHMLGAPFDVGGRVIETPGPDSGLFMVKLLSIPRQLQASQDGIHYDNSAPLAMVRELELKNFYNLGAFTIDPASLTLSVQLGETEPPVTSSNGIPFVELFGLDSWDERNPVAVRGHDGRVDTRGYNSQTRGWVDFANGTLFLPDSRPFAPRLDAAHPFERFLDAQVSRRLRLGEQGAPNPGGEDIYELYSPRVYDVQWRLVARYAAPSATQENP